jgi:hypothetical protein
MGRVLCWLYHFIAYYITWFVCIGYAAAGDQWLGPAIAGGLVVSQVVVQIVCVKPWRRELLFALVLMLIGILVDSIFLRTGLIYFKSNLFADMVSPPWMACLWLSFGFTMPITSSAWLHRYVVLGVLTFFSLPFAYWVGAVVGAATINTNWFYPALGGIWMILLPLLLHYLFIRNKR